jgi:large subunit ribosomal protein L3
MKAIKLLENPSVKKRTGLLLKKLGMTSFVSSNGLEIGCTVLEFETTHVVDIMTEERNGYNAVKIATGDIKKKNVNKPQLGMFSKAKLDPTRFVAEFLVSKDALLSVGDQLSIDHFKVGAVVDVTGISTGKGFAGAMKRWNFRGLEATHGVSVTHRSHGATGQNQDPGKVFKNKKMAGHLGNEKVTIQNLEVIHIDLEKSLLFVKGATPGKKGTYVRVSDAAKKILNISLPYPASLSSTKVE